MLLGDLHGRVSKEDGNGFERHAGQQQFDGERVTESMGVAALDVGESEQRNQIARTVGARRLRLVASRRKYRPPPFVAIFSSVPSSRWAGVARIRVYRSWRIQEQLVPLEPPLIEGDRVADPQSRMPDHEHKCAQPTLAAAVLVAGG